MQTREAKISRVLDSSATKYHLLSQQCHGIQLLCKVSSRKHSGFGVATCIHVWVALSGGNLGGTLHTSTLGWHSGVGLWGSTLGWHLAYNLSEEGPPSSLWAVTVEGQSPTRWQRWKAKSIGRYDQAQIAVSCCTCETAMYKVNGRSQWQTWQM